MFTNFRALPWRKIKPLALFTLCAAVALSAGLFLMHARTTGLRGFVAPVYAAQDGPRTLSPISFDYPEDGSIFPPGITPPMFIWRDAAGTSWSIDITFAGGAAPIHAAARGERMHIGAIDPDTVADSNSPPKLTLQQAASWTWTPDAATWAAIQAHSVDQQATVVITGYRDGGVAYSRSQVRMTTSRDPVKAT